LNLILAAAVPYLPVPAFTSVSVSLWWMNIIFPFSQVSCNFQCFRMPLS
jgi:hypothetical protein